MKVIYVAGPFRSMNSNGKSNAWGVHKNVVAAMDLSLEVWKRGHAALCPHANTAFFQDADGTSDDVWLAGDLEMLKRCDAVLMTPTWERSGGAKAELAFAKSNHIPALFNLEQLDIWLKGN